MGDSSTGHTTTYHGLYHYLRFASVIRQSSRIDDDGRFHVAFRYNVTVMNPATWCPSTGSRPWPLGTLFQTSDAYASAMLAPVSSGGVTMRTINASVLLRVRNRLIFAYIYGSSDDENSLRWIEKMAEQWFNSKFRLPIPDH